MFDDSNYDAMRQAVEDKLKGKWVKFSGWMLFDFIHQDASQSTAPGNPVCPNDGKLHSGCNWRATPWEVHPVTAYTVVSGPWYNASLDRPDRIESRTEYLKGATTW